MYSFKNKNYGIVSVSFLYISALLGAGFATGSELYAYFYRYGFLSGTVGIFISASLFSVTAYKTLGIGALNNTETYDDFLVLLFGKNIGRIFSLASVFFFIMLFSAMAAAFGELLQRFIGIPRICGNFMLCIFSFAILKRGRDFTAKTSAVICPIMLAGCCMIGIYALCDIKFSIFRPIVIPSAIIYTSYNLLTSTAVLCTNKCSGKKQALRIALLIFFAVFSAGLFAGAITTDAQSIFPIYDVLKSSSLMLYVYTVILVFAIITTALGNAYCLINNINCVTVCIFGFLFSLLGFGTLVTKIYFIFGIMGCGLLAGILSYRLK